MNVLNLRNHVRLSTTFRGAAVLIACLAGLLSCEKKTAADDSTGPVESEKVQALRKEVIAVHDEVMPLMTDIYQLKTKLKEKASGGNLDREARSQVDSLLVQLDSADRGMREWMRAFSKINTAGVPETDALNTLNAELQKIKKVKEDMIRSVEAAKAAQ